ncbi:MAG: redoxin domain-containing protein [Haloarculaceae archaeon]
MTLQEGDVVEDVEATLCDGETFRSRQLSAALGERGAVLVSTGLVYSAIARNWWKRFERYGWGEFDGVPVLGFSRDGPYAQNAFLRELEEPPFRFFADVDGRITDALGVRTEREGMAGISTPRRAVFVLDSEREVEYAYVAEDWISPLPHEDMEAAVAEL